MRSGGDSYSSGVGTPRPRKERGTPGLTPHGCCCSGPPLRCARGRLYQRLCPARASSPRGLSRIPRAHVFTGIPRRSLPATFGGIPAPAAVWCAFHETATLSPLSVGEINPRGWVTPIFKATTFTPRALRSSSTFIPLVSTINTQRSAG